ncbi:O-antigen ligase family protein [Bradyrhizobium genosp. L]|uniref:O-antigen ligase family protein n=1 Tax=Bradyrhizobium genosp. L TaxID=83637 RepID=UPI0018A2B8AE|nr:O-antigen ligase [Bradyrhizobium genosp. L]QPF85898.1 O-antigen ligase family protein [Bradyrhizobium genosp. L]
MSDFSITTESRALIADISRRPVMDYVRGAAFVGILLLVWVSLHPFEDLSGFYVGEVTNGREAFLYGLFGVLMVGMLALTMRDNMPALKSLLTPAFLLFAAWICISVVLSFDPATSLRRLALSVFVIVTMATCVLLPKSQAELMRWFGIAALVLLATCYLGVLLAPHLSIHQATDPQEPALAGNWRGAFGHKNIAAAMMTMLIFIGIYLFKAGSRLSGIAVTGLALVFLVFTAGKSSMALCIAVLGLSALTALIRSFWGRVLLLLMPLVLLNLFSVGTVMSDTLASIADLLPLDTSFTGRADIWAFALDSLHQRLWTGYGFEAFWGGDAIQNLKEGKEWAGYASHSHNGYLDTTLGTGLPGLVLLIAAFVVKPLRDFQAADEGGNDSPLTMLFLRIWLFGLYLSSMESFFLDRADTIWGTFLIGLFGLHYLARFRMRAETAA